MKAKDSSIRGIVANGANIVRKTGYVSFVALGASIGLASKLIDQAYEATKDGYKASTTEPTQDNSDIEPWDSASESEPPTPSIDIMNIWRCVLELLAACFYACISKSSIYGISVISQA